MVRKIFVPWKFFFVFIKNKVEQFQLTHKPVSTSPYIYPLILYPLKKKMFRQFKHQTTRETERKIIHFEQT